MGMPASSPPKSGAHKPLGDAKPFQAGNGNVFDQVVKPTIQLASKVASAAYTARKGVLQAREDAAEPTNAEVAKEPTPTKVMPVSQKSEIQAKLQSRRMDAHRQGVSEAISEVRSARVPAATNFSRPQVGYRPEMFDEAAKRSASKAIRGYEVRRAISRAQFNNPYNQQD